MKYSVDIDFMDGTSTRISYVDKVELLNVGGGVMSVIKGRTNFCYTLQMIESYKIMDEEGAKEC